MLWSYFDYIAMNYFIILFGLLILFLGVMILAKPEPIFAVLGRNSESLTLHIVAVVVRFILGTALVTYAGESKFPLALQVIGWLSISAAFLLIVIGRSNFKSLLAWGFSFASSIGRVVGFVAILFGVFLIFSVV